MLRKILIILLLGAGLHAVAQETGRRDYRNFPIVISLQFHSFSLPFRDIKSNFKNIGIGIGTEVSHSGNHDWVQHFDFVWYRNKTMGNGMLISTQAGWRPEISNGIYTEVKLGCGYFVSFRPSSSFKQVNGEWLSAGKKGKGMLAIPVGVAVGYNDYKEESYTSPFAGYQFFLAKGYNTSVPIVPECLIQLGTSIHP